MKMDPATGKIRCFDIAQRRWVQKQGIDYTEGVRMGCLSPTGPTAEVVGDEGAILVCPEEVEAYVKKGYQYNKPAQALPATGTADEAPEVSADPPYNFMQHDMNALRTMARDAGIQGISGMNKQALVDALDASGYVPEDDELDEDEEVDEDELDEDEDAEDDED